MDQNGIVQVKDFTTDAQPKVFTIGGRTFTACADIPIGLMTDLVGLSTSVDNITSDVIEKIFGFFDAVLFDDSAAAFREGARDKKDPIGPKALMNIMEWLMEEYGMRPTVPSDSSSTPSEADGSTSSTAGVSAEASTSQD